MTDRTVSIVIPAWNEVGNISEAIASAWRAGADQVIVSDGGSVDGTLEKVAQDPRVVLRHSSRGRGTQLAAGAEAATGDWMIFLHADNRLADHAIEQIRIADWPAWGGFEQHIDSPKMRYRWIENGNACRARFRSLVFGDQALFVQRELYERVGGFPKIELMEDVVLSQRLRKVCPATCLPGPLRVDARRWENNGVIRQTLRNWMIQVSFRCGVSPQRLRAWYSAG